MRPVWVAASPPGQVEYLLSASESPNTWDIDGDKVVASLVVVIWVWLALRDMRLDGSK